MEPPIGLSIQVTASFSGFNALIYKLKNPLKIEMQNEINKG
jgi:hypothetical protein